MAKALEKPQPKSSVAGILDPSVAAQALSKPLERPESILPVPIVEQLQPRIKIVSPSPVDQIQEILRQFNLSPSADQTLKKLIAIFGEATGLELKYSEFLRATLLGLEHAIPQLTREAKFIGRLKRPKNERAKRSLQGELERKIAKAIVAGLRAMPVFEP